MDELLREASMFEGLVKSLLEAGEIGIPLIVSDSGGERDRMSVVLRRSG